MAKKLGQLEAALLAYCQMRNLRTLRTGELGRPLRITVKQERELLRRRARNGILPLARRELYLVPPRFTLRSRWCPDEALALNTLMEDQGGRYQTCGPNAFQRYEYCGNNGLIFCHCSSVSSESSLAIADFFRDDQTTMSAPRAQAWNSTSVQTASRACRSKVRRCSLGPVVIERSPS